MTGWLGTFSPGALRWRWLLATAVAALLLSLGVASAASAHPYLVASTPQAGVVASQAPTKIQVAFTEGLVIKGCSISVVGAGGKPVRVGALWATLGGDAITAGVGKL